MNNILEIIDFNVYIDITNINDSMELPSHTEICNLTVSNNKTSYVISIIVNGDVKVYWDGTCYKDAYDFPNELLQYYHTHDENILENHDFTEDLNNWFEYFIYKNDEEIGFDTIDIEKETSKELFDDMIAILEEYVKDEGYSIKRIPMSEVTK